MKKLSSTSMRQLEKLVHELERGQQLDIKKLTAAAKSAHDLFAAMNNSLQFTNRYNNNAEEIAALKNFLTEITIMLAKLDVVAQRNKAKPRITMMSQLIAAVDKFLDTMVSKKTRVNFRTRVNYVKFLSSVLSNCEAIPDYWDETNVKEAVGLVFGTTLVLSSLALIMALLIAPKSTATVINKAHITILWGVGAFIQTLALERIVKKRKDKEKINNVIHDIEDQSKELNEFIAANIIVLNLHEEHKHVLKDIKQFDKIKNLRKPKELDVNPDAVDLSAEHVNLRSRFKVSENKKRD